MELGWRPLEITPIFSLGQDWIVTLEPTPDSVTPVYPSGTHVYARIYADAKRETLLAAPLREWEGQVVGDNVVFHVEAAETDTVLGKQYMRIMIIYPGTPVQDPFCWAHGKVERDD